MNLISEGVLSDRVEGLSEKEEKDAEYIIEVFGMTTVSLSYDFG